MPIELHQLRQIRAIAEHRSFVRAAAALHMSQPALSRSIQNIERRVGVDLFARTRSGVTPTDVGRIYIERSRDLLRMADDLERDVGHHGSLTTGRVAVGGGPFTSESLLGRAAAGFVERYPGVSVQVYARNWGELLTQLRGRELDFFVAETSTLHREPDLEVFRMPSSHAVYFVARAGHPLTGRREFKVTDIFAWPFVSPGRIPPRILDPFLKVLRIASDSAQAPYAFPAIECNGLAPVKRIISGCDAVSGSILSCISTELENGSLVLLGTEPWMHLEYGIVSLRDHPATQAAQKFREFVLQAELAASAEEERLSARFASR